MADKEIEQKYHDLNAALSETGVRIRRYTLDPRLKLPPADRPDPDALLRKLADDAWQELTVLRNEFNELRSSPSLAQLSRIEMRWLQLDRKVDLLQRELIAEQSFRAGIKTVTWLVAVLVGLIVLYLFTHGVRSLDFTAFEPWSEWGPMKYGEVAFWASFGVLCALLFQATYYLSRRDFDMWYQPWYLSTGLRAPFLAVILMMVVLEFVEWYGQGKWIENYILEEGNKFYFIVFMSFCLGLASDTTNRIIRDLAEGVGEFVRRAVARISDRLSSTVSDVSGTGK